MKFPRCYIRDDENFYRVVITSLHDPHADEINQCSEKQGRENKHPVGSADALFQWSSITAPGALTSTIRVASHSGELNYAASYSLCNF